MNAIADPLLRAESPDRLHYSTGELLGADDFQAEQTYHRRQLARTLLFLNGSGTVAGLRVTSRHLPGASPALHDAELIVEPGLALDRAGRLIEVPRPACLHLRRWVEFIASQGANSAGADVGDLRAAWREDTGNAAGGSVVADIFLGFHPCERGYTPAFATGPFDALDASQPSRVRDGYELSLVLRPEADDELPVAFDPWGTIEGASLDARRDAAREASLNAWQNLALPGPDHAGDWHENPPFVDPTAVLLARLRLPATRHPAPGDAPPGADFASAAWAQPGANIDNHVRRYLYPPAAISRLANLSI